MVARASYSGLLSIVMCAQILPTAGPLKGGETSPPPPDWKWDTKTLHPEVRRRIHLRVTDVPAFPNENRDLLDPRKWPRTISVKGTHGILQIEAWDYDYGIMKRSVDEVEPHQSMQLFYKPMGGSEFDRVGPCYVWSKSRRLGERIWSDLDAKLIHTKDYLYYPTGELHHYAERTRTRRMRSDKTPYDWFIEYFDPQGRLKAVGYARWGLPGGEVHAFYRYGAPVKAIDFKALEYNLPLSRRK